METLIRTPDMPGVHQMENSVASEVHPSDTSIPNVISSFKDGVDYNYDTGTLLYVNPEISAKKLYLSYNDFTDAVNRCIEAGAGIIWDAYQKFVKLKSANPDKYKEAIEEMVKINENSLYSPFATSLNNLTDNKKVKEELVNEYNKTNGIGTIDNPEDEVCFRKFIINILHDNHNSDIPAILNKNEYFDEIAKLRFGLQNIKSNFRFDVENCIEYTAHRSDCFYSTSNLSSIAFKVKPFIERISLTVGSSIYDSIPVVNYRVCLDMHKIISWLMNNCKLPDELPEFLDSGETVRDEYIRSVLGEYVNFGEKIARRIVMEIYDMSYNISGNWRRFLQKFIGSYNKLLVSNPDTMNLVTKVNYFANFSESHIDPRMAKETDSMNHETFENIFKYINKDYDTYDDQFINQMFTAISDYSDSNKEEFILHQASILFRKTFTVFFENAILINFYRKYDSTGHYSKSIEMGSYTREFYRPYDFGDLLRKASSISDYNIRDFIQTIISEFKSCKNSIYDPGKLANGEYMFFMYSKLSRKLWMELSNLLILTSKLIGMMEQTKPVRDSDIKLHNKVSKTVDDFAEFVYGTLVNMISEARYVPNQFTVGFRAWKFDLPHLTKILKYCSNYAKPVVSRDSHKIDQLVRDVLKQPENKSPNNIVDDGFVVSYNVSDRDKYDLKHNFVMGLQRRGLVSLDF
jgi:hypothetical protein